MCPVSCNFLYGVNVMWCGMFFIGTALTDPLLVTREQASHVSDRPAKTALLAFFGGQWPACKLQRCDDKRNFFFFCGWRPAKLSRHSQASSHTPSLKRCRSLWRLLVTFEVVKTNQITWIIIQDGVDFSWRETSLTVQCSAWAAKATTSKTAKRRDHHQ